jgi:hypothetical protein
MGVVIINRLTKFYDLLREAFDTHKADPVQIVIIANYLRYSTYSKILAAISILKITSVWELRKMLNISNTGYIEGCLDDFISDGIITLLKQNTENYEITCRFWKRAYPNSPFKLAGKSRRKFYCLQDEWKTPIQVLSKHSTRFLKPHIESKIRERGRRYELEMENIENERALYLKLKKDCIGRCHNCNKIIRAGSKRGKHYHKYPIGIICDRCNKTADIDKMREWRRNGRK